MFLITIGASLLLVSNTQNTCYPTVIRHRIDSIFPNSDLFCVSRQNDDIAYSTPVIVQNAEQWADYASAQGIVEIAPKPIGEHRMVDLQGDTKFQLPASISDGDFCSGTQYIEYNRNLTIRCKVKIEKLATICGNSSENGLDAKQFINTLNIFTPMVNTPLVSPEWNGSACVGVMRLVDVMFRVNSTWIVSVDVHIDYGILDSTREHFEQIYQVRFLREEYASNRTSGVGYNAGDSIYAVNGPIALTFSIPSIGNCFSSPSIPVQFGRSISSICELATKSCEDAKSISRKFYEQIYPNEILSAPSDHSIPAMVQQSNITWNEKSPSKNTCRLPVSSLFQIFTSRQGSTKNFHEIIVAGKTQIMFDYVPYSPGQSIRVPVNVIFSEITPEPKTAFASLPYIDIRLPNDFFYPFVRSSSANFSFYFLFLFIFLILRSRND